MKHLKKFESYTKKKHLIDAIKESVMVVDDIYKVRVTAEIPQSLLNSYVKKTKDVLGKKATQFYSDVELAEEITKQVLQSGLNIDKLSPEALFGRSGQQAAQAPQSEAPSLEATPPAPEAVAPPAAEEPSEAPEVSTETPGDEVRVTGSDDGFESPTDNENPEESENERLPESE